LNERQAGLYPLPMEGPLVSDDVLMQVRGAQRRRLISSVRETMWSLNWMHGEFSRPAAVTQANSIGTSKPSHLHGEALRRCSILNFELLSSGCANSPESCLRQLLKQRSIYQSSAASATATFVNALVSLPSSLKDAPLLKALLPAPDGDLLEGYAERLMRPSSEVAELIRLRGEPRTYSDPVLARDSKKYAAFVRRCVKIGMLGYTVNCKSQLGIFVVKK
jgi:hypothetical protein